ncbi:MAG: MBL fold metallo-hydrolase [Bacteroidales bacterium]|jgi:metallo-beta-lactamase family protein|nr:MBL fold metallo-hydrolase [Bacteroidales bacterium]
MKIQFLGAAREVTGSKHLITTDAGIKILLDCGMYQGKGEETDKMNRDLGFNPEEIDYLVLSHAHIDHSGLIPYICNLGFKGKIICTAATRNLCSIMLPDSGFIQENDIKWYNKKLAKKGLPPIEPIYTSKNAIDSIKNFISIPYDKEFSLHTGISLKFTEAGHMLGSGVVNLKITEWGVTTKIAFTGDIGRKHPKLLIPPEKFDQTDYLIMESTYGNRIHPNLKDSEFELLEILQDTCVRKKGKLIIPSFSVGRTQEITYTLNQFFNQGLLPAIDIFIDSPLSVNATEIFKLHTECFNKETQENILHDLDFDIFGFQGLKYVKDVAESKRLNNRKTPCVIISASGMAEAGRVKHHIANSISNKKNTILLVGYCAPSTLGARIQEERKSISIFGTEHKIKADIKKIESFSGHADYKEMIDFISCQDKSKLKKIFLIHGETESQTFFANELKKKGFNNIEIPKKGDKFEIKIKN